MLLKSEVEASVDAVRYSAAKVRKNLEEAQAIKDASMRINEQDEWVRYKTAKCLWQKAGQIEQEVDEAINETNERWRAVPVATNVPQIAFAARAAKAAYRQATCDANNTVRLVGEAKQTAGTPVKTSSECGAEVLAPRF